MCDERFSLVMHHLAFLILSVCVLAIADPGRPLILTPLINSRNIERARNLSRVGVLKDGVDVESYSGYFTVDEETDSNIFFWFFPAETDYSNAPVLVWLQGGPGVTSLMGLFTEHGPYIVNTDKELEKRQIYWSQKYNVIYIDSPVGTGFSYTRNGYSTTHSHVGFNLYKALVQFFSLFPELRKNPFFASGESYAGKMVPALAYTIHINNPDAELKINLQGLAIGNGFCDPENMMLYGDYLYQIGIIDLNTREYFHEKEDEIVQLIEEERYEEAYWVWKYLTFDGDHSYLLQEAGFAYFYNFLYNEADPVDNTRFADFVQQDYVRSALHVGSSDFNYSSSIVVEKLRNQYMQTVRPWIEILLEYYRVLIFNGQLDIIVAYPLTENFLRHLEWSGCEEYEFARRYQWRVGGELAGYVKTAGNLTDLLVRNAGHLAPGNQPLWGLDLITRFVENKPFN